MKKSLIVLTAALSFVALSACSPTSPVSVAVTGAGMTLTNSGNSGVVDVAVGTREAKSLAFVAVAEPGGKLTVTQKPEGAQCSYVDGGVQLYCRLGDFSPLASAQVRYVGRAVSGKLGYLDSGGETKTVEATVINKP